ncbi:MAG: hypothetical protein IH939_17810 [Acidobacteria bacterium]|nr:hypothetical protein [Acidobacteriota bacterium]
MLPRLAVPHRRIATLGATHDFHHGLLGDSIRLVRLNVTRSYLWLDLVTALA